MYIYMYMYIFLLLQELQLWELTSAALSQSLSLPQAFNSSNNRGVALLEWAEP